MLSYILISLFSMLAGVSLTASWCRTQWHFPQWEKGFKEGYILGKRHGIEEGESNARHKMWSDEVEATANVLLQDGKVN